MKKIFRDVKIFVLMPLCKGIDTNIDNLITINYQKNSTK